VKFSPYLALLDRHTGYTHNIKILFAASTGGY
jgi:hypothetical protein